MLPLVKSVNRKWLFGFPVGNRVGKIGNGNSITSRNRDMNYQGRVNGSKHETGRLHWRLCWGYRELNSNVFMGFNIIIFIFVLHKHLIFKANVEHRSDILGRSAVRGLCRRGQQIIDRDRTISTV